MIKLVIFDMDGVLVDAKQIHYRALNEALAEVGPEYTISPSEHAAIYDGLPTSKKLEMLSRHRGLPEEAHDRVWKLKQDKTAGVVRQTLTTDERLRRVLQRLRGDYTIHVASNSIGETVRLMLWRTGLMEFVDHYTSNEDVRHPKPHPEMYMRCMLRAGVRPDETVIVEDSHVGRQAAAASGAHVLGVESPADVTYDRIATFIASRPERRTRWAADNLTVLIPMAGAGQRFRDAGYTDPKPLIDVRGRPMIQLVVNSLSLDAHYVFVVQDAHYNQYHLRHLLNLIAPGCTIVRASGLTQGAVCTTLLAEQFIDNNRHLLIANSDQFFEWDSGEFCYAMLASGLDGGLLTFQATHPKWSFVRVDENNRVLEVAEKNPISDVANVGVYYWDKGRDYVRYARQMIDRDVRTNGEFYIAPVYNEAIADGKKIGHHSARQMWGLGTPEDLQDFLANYKGMP